MGVIEPNRDKACEWAAQWLRAGHKVSAAVLATAQLEKGHFRTFADRDVSQEHDFSWGGVVTTHQANDWLAQLLDKLSREGARCLVVEDDTARRTHPFIIRSEDAWAFIGDRVLAWSDLEPGLASAAIKEVQGVGSGYPRNMFISSYSARELGIADRQQVSQDFPARIAESLMAIIVSIFDAESYLVWTPHR